MMQWTFYTLNFIFTFVIIFSVIHCELNFHNSTSVGFYYGNITWHAFTLYNIFKLIQQKQFMLDMESNSKVFVFESI